MALNRRLLGAAALLLLQRPARAQPGAVPDRRFADAAAAMKRLAEASGDQPYGAVLVLAGRIVGEAPSRVVQRGDPEAHAEREAIRDAQARLGRHGRGSLAGAWLVSTSRPCPRCEAAAASAGVVRMFYGPDLADAGAPGAPANDSKGPAR